MPEANAKERRFMAKIGIEVLDADIADLLAATAPARLAA